MGMLTLDARGVDVHDPAVLVPASAWRRRKEEKKQREHATPSAGSPLWGVLSIKAGTGMLTWYPPGPSQPSRSGDEQSWGVRAELVPLEEGWLHPKNRL